MTAGKRHVSINLIFFKKKNNTTAKICSHIGKLGEKTEWYDEDTIALLLLRKIFNLEMDHRNLKCWKGTKLMFSLSFLTTECR